MEDKEQGSLNAERPFFIAAVFAERSIAAAAIDAMVKVGVKDNYIIYTEQGPDEDARDTGLLGLVVRRLPECGHRRMSEAAVTGGASVIVTPPTGREHDLAFAVLEQVDDGNSAEGKGKADTIRLFVVDVKA